MPVIFLERIANALGILMKARRGLKFGKGFKLTDRPDLSLVGTVDAPGVVTDYTEAEVDPAAVGYRSASISSATSSGRLSALWRNDTAAAVTISGLCFVPYDGMSQSATDFWKVRLVLGSAPTVPIALLDSGTGSAPAHTALAAGTPVQFADAVGAVVDAVSVPAGDVLLLSLVSQGSPSQLGGYAQGQFGG